MKTYELDINMLVKCNIHTNGLITYFIKEIHEKIVGNDFTTLILSFNAFMLKKLSQHTIINVSCVLYKIVDGERSILQ